MTSDLSVFGIYLNGGLVSALVALALHAMLRKGFRHGGLYGLFWHPAVVNISTFVILWGGVSFLFGASLGSQLAFLDWLR